MSAMPSGPPKATTSTASNGRRVTLRHSESEADHVASILKDLPECRADEDAIRQPPEEPERRRVIHAILHHRARAIGLKRVFVPPEAVRALLLKIGKASARLPAW